MPNPGGGSCYGLCNRVLHSSEFKWTYNLQFYSQRANLRTSIWELQLREFQVRGFQVAAGGLRLRLTPFHNGHYANGLAVLLAISQCISQPRERISESAWQ